MIDNYAKDAAKDLSLTDKFLVNHFYVIACGNDKFYHED
ncbi:conserved hypothetical protein [Xenorhabdus nematophila F1]|uniref:Uncharacterized protein n=1 Tax=Xenorhabdus nematophila (strain ATCC 19061 / DSM 3370 / CCUG 14189 / LMG 1036 / NCIMB 9965 / AN6) TaxID=406817 RepID=D3VFM9_XENNA|nr:hypothetical protein XNC1_2284 [Xenorhabdus nematophila ATCC 19061]CCW32342.1 conserved hypothetical protein [Xenorhabdus nematophila F1]